jgi:hypothetical protein
MVAGDVQLASEEVQEEERMSTFRVWVLVLTVLVASSLLAQQPVPAGLLQQSLTAMTGNTPVTDVTMTGTVTVTRGQTTDSGTISLIATAAGRSQTTATVPAGTRTQVRDISGDKPTVTETGPDGVTRTLPLPAALSPQPAWFYPPLIMAAASTTGDGYSYLGQEQRNGATVDHFAIWRGPSAASSVAQQKPYPTQHDIYLDPASLLPVAMTFTLHAYLPGSAGAGPPPSRAKLKDRHEEVAFSDYRQVQGRPVAFHLQVQSDGAALMDIQLSSVSFNTGALVAAH